VERDYIALQMASFPKKRMQMYVKFSLNANFFDGTLQKRSERF
jgi:hypothetical protein